MGRSTLYILSDSPAAETIIGAAGPGQAVVVDCVRKIPQLDRRTWLIIANPTLERCCSSAIASWKRRRAGHLQVIVIDDCQCRASPGAQGSIPEGLRISRGRVAKLVAGHHLHPDTRRAWALRPMIQPGSAPRHLAKTFLGLLVTAISNPVTVAQACRALQVAPRRLHRLCLRWFGIPPHVVLGLARVEAVARDLTLGSRTLSEIADAHGFPDAGSLSRLFLRFAGVRPGIYRGQMRSRS